MEAGDEMDEESLHERETETTIGSVDREDQQDIIEHYATLMLQILIESPYASVRAIMDRLRRVGPFEGKQTILRVFGGREAFKKTLQRMSIVRRAVLEGTLGDLPIETRVPPGEEAGSTLPGGDRFIENWAPWRTGGERHHELGIPEEYDYFFKEETVFDDGAPDIDRYPHQEEETEKYVEDRESGTEMEWETIE